MIQRVKSRLAAVPPALWGIMALTVLLRLVYLYVRGWNLGETPSDGFVQSANFIADGIVTYRINKAPTYTLFLSAFVFLFGNNWLLYRIMQALISAVSALMVYRLGVAAFDNKRVGLLGAVLFAVYPREMHYATEILAENLYVLLMLAFTFALLRLVQTKQMKYVWWAGALLFITAFIKGTLYAFFPFLIVWLWIALRPQNRLVLKYSAYIVGIFAVGYLGWKVFFWTQFDTFALLPDRTGKNMAVGMSRYGLNDEDSRLDSLNQSLAISSDAAKDSVGVELGVELLKERPDLVVQLMVKKALIFWRLTPRAIGLYQATEDAAPTAMSRIYSLVGLLSFAPVFFLGLIGLVLAFVKYRHVFWLWLFIFATFTAVHSFFSVQMRYRVPIEPLLILLAALALVKGLEWLQRRRKASAT